MNSMFNEKYKSQLVERDKQNSEKNREKYKRSHPLEVYGHVANGRQTLAENATLLHSDRHAILRNQRSPYKPVCRPDKNGSATRPLGEQG